jgi:hypothetical protein
MGQPAVHARGHVRCSGLQWPRTVCRCRCLSTSAKRVSSRYAHQSGPVDRARRRPGDHQREPATIDIPVAIIAGSGDPILPVAGNAIPAALGPARCAADVLFAPRRSLHVPHRLRAGRTPRVSHDSRRRQNEHSVLKLSIWAPELKARAATCGTMNLNSRIGFARHPSVAGRHHTFPEVAAALSL